MDIDYVNPDNTRTVFRDRREGGRRLLSKLERYRAQPAAVVLGLPRGGVATAAEIAAASHYRST
jgi:predicted phosphoribosyltransferase